MDTLSSFGNPLIILNPAANRGKMDKHRAITRDRADREQVRYVETSKQGEAIEFAMLAAKEARSVIVVCGDGLTAQIHEKRIVLMAETNGPTYASGFRINPKADTTGGLLEVCAVDYGPFLRAPRLLPIVKKGDHTALPEVTFYLAKSVF